MNLHTSFLTLFQVGVGKKIKVQILLHFSAFKNSFFSLKLYQKNPSLVLSSKQVKKWDQISPSAFEVFHSTLPDYCNISSLLMDMSSSLGQTYFQQGNKKLLIEHTGRNFVLVLMHVSLLTFLLLLLQKK